MIENWITTILKEVSKEINSDNTVNFEKSEHPIEDLKNEVIKRTLNNKTFKANRKKTLCAEDIWILFVNMYTFLGGGTDVDN